MVSYYDLYGVKDLNLDEASHLLESNLGIVLLPYEGLHNGEYYKYERPDSRETYFLRENIDLLEDEEPFEPDFPDYPVLLYAEGMEHERLEEIRRLLDVRFCMLRRKVVDAVSMKFVSVPLTSLESD
jgi:hypothetical protein